MTRKTRDEVYEAPKGMGLVIIGDCSQLEPA